MGDAEVAQTGNAKYDFDLCDIFKTVNLYQSLPAPRLW